MNSHIYVEIFRIFYITLVQSTSMMKKRQGIGEIRLVKLYKEEHEGLGMSITVSVYIVQSIGNLYNILQVSSFLLIFYVFFCASMNNE